MKLKVFPPWIKIYRFIVDKSWKNPSARGRWRSFNPAYPPCPYSLSAELTSMVIRLCKHRSTTSKLEDSSACHVIRKSWRGYKLDENDERRVSERVSCVISKEDNVECTYKGRRSIFTQDTILQ